MMPEEYDMNKLWDFIMSGILNNQYLLSFIKDSFKEKSSFFLDEDCVDEIATELKLHFENSTYAENANAYGDDYDYWYDWFSDSVLIPLLRRERIDIEQETGSDKKRKLYVIMLQQFDTPENCLGDYYLDFAVNDVFDSKLKAYKEMHKAIARTLSELNSDDGGEYDYIQKNNKVYRENEIIQCYWVQELKTEKMQL